MAYETILFRREETDGGRIATITLHRPEVRNAINEAMIRELGAALDEVAADPEARAIVLTGSGDRAFAAGADIAELLERTHLEALARINAGLFRRIEEHPLPTIAAIRGYALGGGCELAMACDIRIAGEDAKLGQPEVGLGILPGAGAIQRLPRLVGLGRAKELVFTGRIVDAKEAEAIGLVNRVVPPDDVVPAAMEVARTIAKQGSLAVRISKLALNAAGRPTPAFETLDTLGQAVLFDSAEKKARMQAFLDSRKRKASR
jgi:enoyl-CoA hydratase